MGSLHICHTIDRVVCMDTTLSIVNYYYYYAWMVNACKAATAAISSTSGQTMTMLVCCHVGAGASMCAIEKGKCIDTSMGLTPLEG